jgi:hypothetical protein
MGWEKKMDENDFYKLLGLISSPFQHTNADEEDSLELYFVPPPYFSSVWGDPKNPTSVVVFAPRGGGKSAQRRMIEIRARTSSNVLAIQYSRFEFEGISNVHEVDLAYHLKNINRLCLIAFLILVYERNYNSLRFSATERKQIIALSDYYLQDLSPEVLIGSVDSIMTFTDKAKKFCKNNLWAINTIVDSLFKKIGLSPVKGEERHSVTIASPSKNHLEIILSLIISLGLDSVYILVDKIDETALTGNDSKASFDLASSLIKDLDLLQMKRVCFKFFLWNELKPYYQKYARPDRISQFDLSWAPSELETMLEQRLKAFSPKDKPVPYYNMLSDTHTHKTKRAILDLVIAFSQGSPRDLIRICRHMVSEQLRLNPNADKISLEAVTAGCNVFCKQRADEVAPDHLLSEMQKNHRLDFTVNYVASDVFKIGQNAARSKINTWLKTGVVKYINDIHIPSSKKPVHHYAVVDSRIAKSIFPEMRFLSFLQNKVRTCPKCGTVLLRDWDISKEHICHGCKRQFK